MSTYRYGEHTPRIHDTTYVADSATVIGQVTLSRDASVWSQAVLRGDNEHIVVGEGSNIQEGAVLHNDPGFPLLIGKEVTIGHQAMLHGCTVGDGSLIGIQAIVMNGAVGAQQNEITDVAFEILCCFALNAIDKRECTVRDAHTPGARRFALGHAGPASTGID